MASRCNADQINYIAMLDRHRSLSTIEQMPMKKITEAVSSNDQQTKCWKQLFAAGRMAYEAGEFRQAESLLARALEVAHNLPERSLAENITEVGVGATLVAEQRSKEAVRELTKCISALEGSGDSMQKELLAVGLRYRAEALIESGDERTAEMELERSADLLTNLGSDALVQLAYSLSDLSGLLVKHGRKREAEKYILSAMKILGEVLGTQHAEYMRAQMVYTLTLLMEDTSLVDSAADGIRQMEYVYGAKHPHVTEAVDHYIALLEQQGNKVKIEEAKSMFDVKSTARINR